MRNRFAMKTLSFVLAVMVPATMAMADMRGAILHSTGEALLNGAAARRGSAVLAGDVVQSKKGAVVSLASSGNTVVLLGDSQLKYLGTSIDIQAGGAEVTTNSGMSARVDGVTVVPAEKNSRYEVGKKDGQVLIAAVTGSVRITDATGSMVLPAGSMATLDNAQEDKRQPSAGIETKGSGPKKISRRVALSLLFGAGAGAATGAWLTTDNPRPISGSSR